MIKISTSNRVSRMLIPVLALALAMLASWAQEDDISFNTRTDIEAMLDKRVNQLAGLKNADGDRYRRGGYSKLFKKIDDSTVEITFYEDTATEGRMKTERILLTLKNTGGTQWEIVGEEVQDTYEGLYRTVPGDEKFHSFDSVNLELEGLVITGTKGSYVVDFMEEKVAGFTIEAGDLAYEYEPPPHAGAYPREVLAYFTETERDDFLFEPDRVNVSCSPQECERILSTAFTGVSDTTIDDVDAGLRDAYNEYIKEQRQDRKDDPFDGFQLPYEPDHRLVNINIKRKGVRDHYLGLNYNSYDGWDVYFGASGHGPILAHYSKEVAEGGTSPYELELREDSFGRDYDVVGVSGTVELSLEETATMDADLTFTLRAKRPLTEIEFFVARQRRGSGDESTDQTLFINAIQDGEGNDLTGVKTGRTSGIIVLSEEVPAGAEFQVRTNFQNRDAVYKITTSYSRLARSGWLPFVAANDMIPGFDLTVKVPSKYKTLGVGKKVEERVEGDVSITRWQSEFPISFPTVIFGDYYVGEPEIEAKKSDGTSIPVVIHADKDGMRSWDIRGKQLGPIADMAVNSLNLFREIYGVDYPFEKLDLVNDPTGRGGGFYGQSPASIVYLGSGVFRGAGAVGIGSGDLTKFNDSVVAHEVGHQWFGSLINNKNNRSYWFVESLAEYSAALYIEAVNSTKDATKGWEKYLEHVEDWRHSILDSGMHGSVHAANNLNVGGRTAAIYNKGPYAFHMMRMIWGTEKMDAFLKNLGTELAGKEIVTRDIQKVAEESFGGDMEWFFDQWIRSAGIPQYSMYYTTRRTEDGNYLVQGVVRQRVVIGKEQYPVPDVFYRNVGAVTVTDKKGTEYPPVRFIVEGAETEFQFKVPAEPLEVAFNKYGEILAHDVLVNQDF